MIAIIVDDEPLALQNLSEMLHRAQLGYDIHSFSSPSKALDFVKEHEINLAFLDIEMYGMNGIELAKAIKDMRGQANIIFVTGHSQYALDAFSLHASGYLLKPTSVERITEEISNLRKLPEHQNQKKIMIQTFGNFEVFYDNRPLDFGRGKAKELLAYLVDRKGAGCTMAQLCAILWEDKEYSLSLQKQFQTIVSDLMKSLKQVDAQNIIIKKRNFLSVDCKQFSCDYYRFLEGDVSAINSYTGEYMSNYSWAEFTTGFLSQRLQFD